MAEVHDSRDDNGDGFSADVFVRAGWPYKEPTPVLTLQGRDGEVVIFGVGEIEALMRACSRALSDAQRVGDVGRAVA